MNSFQEFGLVVVGHVTAISFATLLLILLSRHNAAIRHSVGLLGLLLVLSSPLWAGILPHSRWWRPDSRADALRLTLETSVSLQSQQVTDKRRSDTSDLEPIEVGTTDPVESQGRARRARPTTGGASLSNVGTGHHSGKPIGFGKTHLNWLLNLAGAVWMAGSVVLMARWLWLHWRLRWLRSALSIDSEMDSPASDSLSDEVCGAVNLRRLPPIVVSDLVPMAMVLGIWRPIIVLPRELLQFGTATRVRDVLIHECAHVARHDPWVNAAQRLAAVLWWWHPGVLRLNRWLARSREEVCDNFVLRHGDALAYAQTLLELTELCSARLRFVPALQLLGSRWTLEERITGLLKPGRDTLTQTRRRTAVLIAALLGGTSLLVGGVRAVDESQPKSNAAKEPDLTAPKPPTEEKPNTKALPLAADEKVSEKARAQSKDQAAPQENAVPDRKPVLKTISGRIVDGRDLPVAGARLWWVVSRGIPEGVIVSAVSDEQGRFSMSTPDVAPPRPSWVCDTLWVLQAGKQLATARAESQSTVAGKKAELLIRLEPETDTSFVVMSPGQKPLAGVEVEPWHFRTHQGYDIIPAQVRKIMSATTDVEGRVRMPNMPRKGFHTVRASSDLFGVQELRLDSNQNPPSERSIRLRATGRIEGQLKADNSEWVRGVQLWFTTDIQWREPPSGEPGWKTEGIATVTTDGQGRFVLPAIAAGHLLINVRPEKNMLALPRLSKSGKIVEGATEKLEIKLESTVLVRGTIRTQDTDKPIPAAEIYVRYGAWRQGENVLSDAEGRYQARVLPGPVYTQVIVRPKEFDTYVQVGEPWDEKIDVRADAAPFDLPPIRLVPTIPLQGKLIDQDGRPVAKARVNGVKGNRRYGFATTNPLGEFSAQIPKTITLESYQVWIDDGIGTPPIAPTIEKSDPLILRITLPRK